MNKRPAILAAFALTAAAQLAVLVAMIAGHERTLREGLAFKFRTQPVDPVDVFRGRYVALRLEPQTVRVSDAGPWRSHRRVYAVLGTDTNGFATVTRLSQREPKGEPFVRVQTAWYNDRDREVHIDWRGLNRYYMEENQAPKAETAYAGHSVRTNRTCHVSVRVRGSHAAVEGLFIENRPIREWLTDHDSRSGK